jgi:hypothetical protein
MPETWKIWDAGSTSKPRYESEDKEEIRRAWLVLRNDGELVELESPDGESWFDPEELPDE